MAKGNVKNNKKVSATIWIIGAIVVLGIVFILSYNLFKSTGKFEYQGVTFTKEYWGNAPYIIFYDYKYMIPGPNNMVYDYTFRVRTNPSENNVPIYLNGTISFPNSKKVYISIDNSLGICNQSIISIAGLRDYIISNQFILKSGVSDKLIAQQNNLSYVDCNTDSSAMIISLRQGNETKVYQEGNCYIVEASDCQILPATEKFEVQSLVDAINRAKSK